MPFLSSLLFACSVNIDAFLIGMSCGVRKMRIGAFQNLLVSLISFAGTALSLRLGRRFLFFLPDSLAKAVGDVLLCVLGLFYLLKAIGRPRSGTPSKSLTAPLPLRELLLLGSALSLNNIGIGIGAGCSGILLLPAAAMTLLCAVCFLAAGNRLGYASRLCLSDRHADLISGALLILLSLCGSVWR